MGETNLDNLQVWAVPTTFTPVAGTAITAVGNNINLSTTALGNSATFKTQNYTILSSAFAGNNMRLVFEWKNNALLGTQTPAAIDNIVLNKVPCPKPTALAVSNIGVTNATFNWNNGGAETQWEIILLPAGSPAPTATSTGIIVNANPSTINTLTAATIYNAYVRSRCNATDISFWSAPITYLIHNYVYKQNDVIIHLF